LQRFAAWEEPGPGSEDFRVEFCGSTPEFEDIQSRHGERLILKFRKKAAIRVSVGCVTLPLGAPVEIGIIAQFVLL